ncbi:MAG: serine/threonine protein kinase [Planctomycetes bacterium]|nr:serine/threonine protein kinase [Planctomycetota bacterium]
MANAQDEAFVELGARRGVLPPEVVRAARELRRDVGSDEPLAQLLLAGKLLAPAVVAGLLRDLTRGGFACERCGERARYDGLARLERLACPRCAGPLAFVDPSASDGGLTAPEPPRPTGAHPAVRPTGTYPAAQPSGYHPAARATGTFGAVNPGAMGPGSGPRATGVHPAARRPSGPLPPPAPTASAPPASVPPPDAWDAEATVIDKNKRRAQAAAARASVVVDDTLRAPAHEPVDSTVRDGRVLGLPGGGRTIGPYTLLQEIGRGAGGVIFLARRPGLERRFAIKLLLGDMARDEEAVARFKREAAVASKVDDPGIIAVYDTGCDGGRYYYVMEFCPGPTLEARLMDGPMPHDDAARLVLSLARTVQAAHDRGVVHRDLKPANIIIEEGSGRPRVMDFGVARDVGANAGLSRTGELLGTPAYMAPEQLKGERDVDHRVDVYALGVILFECLAGRRPHVAATTVQLAERVIMEDAPALRTVAPTAPPALELVCRRALARDRAGRYDQARALARDLERYLAGRGVRAPAREGRARDRWTGRLVGAAALALAPGGLGAGLARAWSDHAAANEAREREAATAARAERRASWRRGRRRRARGCSRAGSSWRGCERKRRRSRPTPTRGPTSARSSGPSPRSPSPAARRSGARPTSCGRSTRPSSWRATTSRSRPPCTSRPPSTCGAARSTRRRSRASSTRWWRAGASGSRPGSCAASSSAASGGGPTRPSSSGAWPPRTRRARRGSWRGPPRSRWSGPRRRLGWRGWRTRPSRTPSWRAPGWRKRRTS